MVYEKFQTQKEIRIKRKILLELKESPKRFKDLQNKLKFSPMGLMKILSGMKEEQKIEKVMYQGHEAYSLTKKGNNEVN
ncbi:MAG: winged helix-turn-helix transcriptional regulator [Candidatus Parvarchaeota archaeon]